MRLLALPLFLMTACTAEPGPLTPTDTGMADTAPEAEVFEPSRMYIHMELGLQDGEIVSDGESASSMGLIFTGSPWMGDFSAEAGNHCTIVFPASTMSVDLTPTETSLARVTVAAPPGEFLLQGADCEHLSEDAWGGESLQDIAARGLTLFVGKKSGALDPVVATKQDEHGFASYLDAHIEWDGTTRLMAAAGAMELADHSVYLDPDSFESMPNEVFVQVWPSQYYDRPTP